jgi:hypothetical protein
MAPTESHGERRRAEGRAGTSSGAAAFETDCAVVPPATFSLGGGVGGSEDRASVSAVAIEPNEGVARAS